MRRRSRLVIMLRCISDELGVTQKKWEKVVKSYCTEKRN